VEDLEEVVVALEEAEVKDTCLKNLMDSLNILMGTLKKKHIHWFLL
jgi:hypothetical protein